jgi:hypothetical protein
VLREAWVRSSDRPPFGPEVRASDARVRGSDGGEFGCVSRLQFGTFHTRGFGVVGRGADQASTTSGGVVAQRVGTSSVTISRDRKWKRKGLETGSEWLVASSRNLLQ